MNTEKLVKQNPPEFPKAVSLLPEPPNGKRWVYRGKGWSASKEVSYICSFDTGSWDKDISHKIPGGDDDLHYAELVDSEGYIFTKEAQAELAKQWVLEGGFDRERWNVNHWQESGINTWTNGVIYRRKPQPTQEELDAQAAKEYSKIATIHPDTTVIEKAYIEGIKHERNRNK